MWLLSKPLILGIGVAYATPKRNENIKSLDDITAVLNWGTDMDNHEKVPSVYSYSRKVGKEQNWGSSLAPDAVAMIHTKLELDVQSVSDELDFILKTLEGTKNLNFDEGVIQAEESGRKYPDKSSEDIVTDYMTEVFKYLMQENILLERLTVLKYASTDIVVTVPTV
jgi:hypothetical protein